jgi:hypothetical protein
LSKFVVIAGGPSFDLKQCRTVAIAKQRDQSLNVIAINDAVYPCYWADYAYACDGQWWDFHGPLYAFRGGRIKLKVIDAAGNEINTTKVPGLHTFRANGIERLCRDPTEISTGKNSGFQAVHVAYHLGATRIVLVGFDFRDVMQHWFGEHPKDVRRSAVGREWVRYITNLGAELEREGVAIVNATTGSAITAFPFVDLKEELGVPDV